MISHAIILAGGDGTRLRPVTLEMPKPLVPVQGTPIATWLVEWFRHQGVERVTVIYPTRWKNAFVDWARRTAVELFEETEPMGTMGALVHQIELGDESFFVTNGDELKGLDLAALETFHLECTRGAANHAATIALVSVPNPSEYGVAELEGHRIARFHEKPANPPTNLISSGLYILNPSVLCEVDRTRRHLMFERDLFPRLAEEGRLAGCALDGQWFDCGTMERWERAIIEWNGKRR